MKMISKFKNIVQHRVMKLKSFESAFTLVELLAVIVILGVLALIIYPVIQTVIKNNEKKVFRASIEGILNATQIDLADDNYNAPRKYYYDRGILMLKSVGTIDKDEVLKTEGKVNGSGYIYIDEDGNIIVNYICDKKWCGYNTVDDSMIKVVPNDGSDHPEIDPMTPQITLNGDRNVLVRVGTSYQELGAIAQTVSGKPLTYETAIQKNGKIVSQVDTSVVSDYVITYTTTNQGMTAFVTRNVKVVDPTPQLTITRANSDYVASQVVIISAKAASPNTLSSVTYQINDGEIVSIEGSSLSLELKETGVYTIKVRAVDNEGNEKEIIGGPYKIDDTGPLITVPVDTRIKKEETIDYNLFDGVTIHDNVDGEIPATAENVTITGSLNAIPGTYEITYQVADSLGNIGVVTRTIIVYVPVNTWVIADKNVHGNDGANEPVLSENMFAVKYNMEGNVSNKWYDYDQKLWANMVLIKADKRDKYKNAIVDTEIDLEDVLGFYVWIPRFQYTIFNGNGSTVSEQEISITFEKGTATTGTVSCVYDPGDPILLYDPEEGMTMEPVEIYYYLRSETCRDSVNTTVTNGVSTYTHPAFTFGTKELTGFWFAKFELSGSISGLCTSADCTTAYLTSLPNQLSLTNKTIQNFFYATLSMTRTGNIYGLTGVESHMIKNMEWGAVSYLSHSKYGKTDKVYVNNAGEYDHDWWNAQQHFQSYTGRSSGSNNVIPTLREQYGVTDSTADNRYSVGGYYTYDGKAVALGGTILDYVSDRTLGTGASTTGNVTGVYDMSGGSIEATMSIVNEDLGSSGFTDFPEEKYYDKYAWHKDKFLGKLGDATVETKRDNTYITGQWYGNGGWTVHRFVKRGYFFNGEYSAGLFSYGETGGAEETSIGTRNVIIEK